MRVGKTRKPRPSVSSPCPDQQPAACLTSGSDDPGRFRGLADAASFYFVHSFIPQPTDPDIVVGTTTYGSDLLAVAVQKGNITGLQFHPERSGVNGLLVLEGFVVECNREADAA